MNNVFVVTVAQVNRRISMKMKEDSALREIYVKGEISNFVNHYKSGHLYFTLKDSEAAIKCVMFREYAEKLNFVPDDGASVIVKGYIGVYERDGVYQLYSQEMERDGIGDMYVRYEQLKDKLNQEGLFSRKRKLPAYPRKIAVVTAKNGAALQDILNIIGRRYPLTSVLLIPALVQGKTASISLLNAVEAAQNSDADLLIIARGGGSFEDLLPFSDETLIRALYNSKIPTISAVGHETDFSICDFVCDMRAPTPSAAAELAVPDISVLKSAIDGYKDFFTDKVLSRFNELEREYTGLLSEIKLKSPKERILSFEKQISSLEKQILLNFTAKINECDNRVEASASVISALNPINTLQRGYAIAEKENNIVSSIKSLNCGDNITIRLSDGIVRAKVTDIEKGKA